MNFNLFFNLLSIDSTNLNELCIAEFVLNEMSTNKSEISVYNFGDNQRNILLTWGSKPKILFCTHLDTVPPYIKPSLSDDGNTFYGRGSCDAKGQIFTMYSVCTELEKLGYTNFGFLLLSGEEAGSLGARNLNNRYKEWCSNGKPKDDIFCSSLNSAEYIIVGEPTDNKFIKAGKGVRHYKIEIEGKPAHSGYPQFGINAIDGFINFCNYLNNIQFPKDNILGDTTFNIGQLESKNPQNIVSSNVSFRIYFRTTFASHKIVEELMEKTILDKDWQKKILNECTLNVEKVAVDNPISFYTPDKNNSNSVAFGSDAPLLSMVKNVMLYGAGSILTAHTLNEQVSKNELEMAKDDILNFAIKILK